MTVVFLVDGIFFEEVESKRKFSRKSIDFLPVVGVALSSVTTLSSTRRDLIFDNLGDFLSTVFNITVGDDSILLLFLFSFFFVSSGVYLAMSPYKSNFFTTRFFIGDCNDDSGVARFTGNKAVFDCSNASIIDGAEAYRTKASRLLLSSSSSFRALAKKFERTIGLFGTVTVVVAVVCRAPYCARGC